MSSSDSASTKESSGHSGKVRRLLLLDNEQDDERGGGRGAKTQTASDQSKISVYLGIHMVSLLTVNAASLSQSQASHIQPCGFLLTYCCLSGCWSAAQMKARCWFLPFLSPSLRPPSTSPSLPKNWREKTHTNGQNAEQNKHKESQQGGPSGQK